MECCNHRGAATRFLGAAVLVLSSLAVMSGGTPASAAASATIGKPALSVLSMCRADLSKRLKLSEEEIKLDNMEPEIWSDASLGMPETGKFYAQVKTPGNRVILEARNTLCLYTTSTKSCKYGGPVRIWSSSMLYLQPIKNEPNLNDDLYQCSLIGTNAIRLVSGVKDYYPQNNGLIVADRRTSRSSFDLLSVRADKPGKEKILYHAFAFGAVSVDESKDRWAGYVKPGLGGEWDVVVGQLDKDGSPFKVIPIPDDVRPGEIAWSGETLMILAKKEKGSVAFETNPSVEKPEWKQIPQYYYPRYNRFMLNKSESLAIEEVTSNGKPEVDIALVWFTGDRNVVARISGLTLDGFDLLGGYAFVWGHKDSLPAAYAVNIHTGEYVVSNPGRITDIKPFAFHPYHSPIPEAPKIE